jgi:hypothetical protein
MAAQLGLPGAPASPGTPGPASPAGPPGGAGGIVGGGASQRRFVQLEEQQSAPTAHAALVAAQTVTQALVAGSQCSEQQSPSEAHAAFWPRHAPGGSPHRPSGSQRSSSLVAPQQPDCGPLPQSSPVGRQREFARSTPHSLVVGSHTPEQQSEFTAHVALTVAHSSFAQTPPKHPSEQQSCAVAQATPSARHASRHWMTPASAVTGSQRPLQQSGPIVQLASGAPQVPAPVAPSPPGPPVRALPTHPPPLQVPEQQSKPVAHAPSAGLHALAAGAAPGGASVPTAAAPPPQAPALQAPTQQSEAATHAAPIVAQVARAPAPLVGPPNPVLPEASVPASPGTNVVLLPPQQTSAVAVAAMAPIRIALRTVFWPFMTSSSAGVREGAGGRPRLRPRRTSRVPCPAIAAALTPAIEARSA